MSRPDWVKCVVNSDIEHSTVKRTWCGKRVEAWCFVDAEHAALNGAKGQMNVACVECTDEIIKGLRAGHK